MRKYAVEFIGTFFLMLTIGMVVLGGLGNFAPLAIGGVLAVLVYAGAHVSGAHYNPAVTLAVWIRGKISSDDARVYVLVQLIAAVAASLVVICLAREAIPSAGSGLVNSGKALLAEMLGTFALVYVVLHVATAKATHGNSYFGLAIGFVVTAMAYAFGGLSAAAFNPAVAVGLSAIHLSAWSDIWVYLAGGLSAGIVAAYAFAYTEGDK